MKIFNCDSCGEIVYFENSQCLKCGAQLGFLPDRGEMSALKPRDETLFEPLSSSTTSALYRKCNNYRYEHICNWMVVADDPEELCRSCRLNLELPDLSFNENRIAWQKMEQAKRRLIYTLLQLELPLAGKREEPVTGVGFSFLNDQSLSGFRESAKVVTGHAQGVITINLAEADDVLREKMRLKMKESYRTLLGHFRHEIGHYYWSRLVESDPLLLEKFRELFGDERESYDRRLKNYYKNGPRAEWSEFYISAYASAHPWEDWAESWAHYLHLSDALETAIACGVSVENASGKFQPVSLSAFDSLTFGEMLNSWIHLSLALNCLNRSMGLVDIYPFVLSSTSIAKMEFIHNVIFSQRQRITDQNIF